LIGGHLIAQIEIRTVAVSLGYLGLLLSHVSSQKFYVGPDVLALVWKRFR